MKTKSNKKWTYPRSANVYKDGEQEPVIRVLTQLYQIGIYLICYYGSDFQQYNFTPIQAKKFMEKQLGQENLRPGLRVEYGLNITVTKDEDGLYKEVK